MPRPLQRANLGAGLSLDLNSFIRRGMLIRNGFTRSATIRWTNSYWGEIASGVMTADMAGESRGHFTIQLGRHERQAIALRAQPRRFGGRQWYFVCPVTGRLASVLWRPPGATRFASRQAFGRSVAYQSQFLDRDSRAHHAQAKLKRRLCDKDRSIDPDEWDFPPKPKWMRQATYARYEARFDGHDATLDEGAAALAAKLFGR